MVRLLMIADDFTGSLDAGVQFAVRGAKTCVVTDPAYDLSQTKEDVQVLVLDAETRHLEPEAAYRTVYRAVESALGAGFSHIYKKTDSALRGNIGAELAAVLDAAGADRGAQRLFGEDPFEPVTASSVSEILGAQTEAPVVLHRLGEGAPEPRPGIQVYDAETEEDLRDIGRRLGREGAALCAGCAGFASVLADLLELEGTPPGLPYLEPSLFVACGSVNPVTLRQMETAEAAGFPHVHLRPVQKLEPAWLETPECAAVTASWLETARRERRFILDVNDPAGCGDTADYAGERGLTTEDLRVRISDQLGHLVRRLLDGGLDATILCTGGDTLMALTRAVGVAELMPVCELDTGAVLTDFVYRGKTHHIISKSGGFGGPDLFIRLARSIGAGEQEEDVIC